MATELDYAALSALVYNDARRVPNKLDPSADWKELSYDPYDNLSGFIAGADNNGTMQETVIACFFRDHHENLDLD
jgi:hypothetical protein